MTEDMYWSTETQLPGTRWDCFKTLVFTGRRGLDMIFEVQVVSFVQKHAEHWRPQTSHVGAWEELEINGPVWREEAVVGSSSHFRSRIRVCIQVKFAWERCWCHSNSSFWELDKFWFAELRIDFVWATLATEYAKASHQKEVGVSLGTNGNKGRQLHSHKCAWRIKSFFQTYFHFLHRLSSMTTKSQKKDLRTQEMNLYSRYMVSRKIKIDNTTSKIFNLLAH